MVIVVGRSDNPVLHRLVWENGSPGFGSRYGGTLR